MIQAGIKDLKNRLSDYLRQVKGGERILITERKKVIATIVPVGRTEEDSRLLSLVKEGFATWNGDKPAGCRHPVKIKGRPLSEIILEERR